VTRWAFDRGGQVIGDTKARDTRANIVGRHCWLSFWRPTMTADTEARQSSANNFEKKKNISHYVVFCILFSTKMKKKPQNFSKETTLATIIDTMKYIYRPIYILWDIIALTWLLAKIAQEKSITLDP